MLTVFQLRAQSLPEQVFDKNKVNLTCAPAEEKQFRHFVAPEEKATIILNSFPNPAINDLHISLPTEWQGKEVRFELMNRNGESIKVQKNFNARHIESIPVTGIGKGSYYVKAFCGNQFAQKIIFKN